MGRDVAGEALEHDRARGIALAQPASKLLRIELRTAEYAQEAELAFEHARRTSKAVGGERSREHATLGRAPEVKTLHHGAVLRPCEFQQPASKRACDAQCVSHALGIEAHQPAAGDCGTERPRGAGRMEAARRRRTRTRGLCRGGAWCSNTDQCGGPAGVEPARARPRYDGASAYDRGIKRPLQKVSPADDRKDAPTP